MIKILAIGNSFSEDATYFLHDILNEFNICNLVVNLYIGGCSLERHWDNILNNKREYEYQVNGLKTNRIVSVEDVLNEEEFDFIITQQVSSESGIINSYDPFLGNIINYLKSKSKATILLNQTWAYDKDSDHLAFIKYDNNQENMYNCLNLAYTSMASKYYLGLIPSGKVIQKLRSDCYFIKKDYSICRDGFHLDFTYGRFLVSLVWARYIFKVNVKNLSYVPVSIFDKDRIIDYDYLNIIKELVDELV